MAKRVNTFTGKFMEGQRVKNVATGYVGTVIEVDPDSYNPPRGTAKHNPYRVRYDHWILSATPWEPEHELELAK